MLDRILAVITVFILIFLFVASACLDEADIEDISARTIEGVNR